MLKTKLLSLFERTIYWTWGHTCCWGKPLIASRTCPWWFIPADFWSFPWKPAGLCCRLCSALYFSDCMMLLPDEADIGCGCCTFLICNSHLLWNLQKLGHLHQERDITLWLYFVAARTRMRMSHMSGCDDRATQWTASKSFVMRVLCAIRCCRRRELWSRWEMTESCKTALSLF